MVCGDIKFVKEHYEKSIINRNNSPNLLVHYLNLMKSVIMLKQIVYLQENSTRRDKSSG